MLGSSPFLLLVSLLAAGRRSGAVSTDDIFYLQGGGVGYNQTNRTLTQVLAERLSVLDFGAKGNCMPGGPQPPGGGIGVTAASCPHDDTFAFKAALKWVFDGRWGNIRPYGILAVPAGSYRVDGTINLYATSLHLDVGATLLRTKLTSNTDPIVRLAGPSTYLTGLGTVTSANPSPRGVVNVGPETLEDNPGANICNSLVSGVSIAGAGVSWSWVHPTVSYPELNRSIGLCLDSSESHTHTGVNYQNTVSNVRISDVDIGVKMSNDVNANTLSNIMMASIGQNAYLLTCEPHDACNDPTLTYILYRTYTCVPLMLLPAWICLATYLRTIATHTSADRAAENTITGGFVAGGGGNVTIIKSEGAALNWL